MLYLGSGSDGTSPYVLSHAEWLRLRKQAVARGILPWLGYLLWSGIYLLGSYSKSQTAGLVPCASFDLTVLEAVGEEGRADLANGRVTMEQLRLSYRLRNGGGDRALEALKPERVLKYIDNLTAPSR